MHLVKHEYDAGLVERDNVTVSIPLPNPPTAVTLASPETVEDTTLPSSCANGSARLQRATFGPSREDEVGTFWGLAIASYAKRTGMGRRLASTGQRGVPGGTPLASHDQGAATIADVSLNRTSAPRGIEIGLDASSACRSAIPIWAD